MKHTMLCTLVVLGIAWCDGFTAWGAEQQTIYVSPQGSNDQPCSLEKPVATPDKALEIVRAIRQSRGGVVDIRVVLGEGVYRITDPIRITIEHAPGPGALTITSEGKPVVISGGRKIEGWKQTGNRFETVIPEVAAGKWSLRELFVNGRRAVRARSPNEGFVRIDRPGADRRTSLFIYPLDAWIFKGDLKTAEFVYLHDWSTSRVKIAGFNPTTQEVTFSQSVGCSAPHYQIGNWPHARYFIENCLQALDAPGEWFLDESTGKLIYLPREGETLESFEAVAPAATALVDMAGDSQDGRLIKNVRWEGLTFEHCRFDLPEKGYASGQATVYEPRVANRPGREMMPAAVTVDLAEKCEFVNCGFRHLGGSGLWFRQQCRHCGVRRCSLEDISGNGINIGETMTRPWPTSPGDWSSPYQNGCTFDVQVADTVVQRCGAQFYEAVGVWIGIAAGCVVEHNEVAFLPYTGISVGWSWNDSPTGCGDHMVARNHIHHCMQILHDGGGIYTLGRQPGTRLAFNVIHDIPPNEDGAESNGIFMDEGSSDILVEGQTIYAVARSPLRFHRALELTLRKNRLICLPGVPAYRYNRTDPNTLRFEEDEIIESENWQPGEELLKEVGARPGP